MGGSEVVDPDKDLFVVVCKEMHQAYGPFVSLDLAAAMSREMTKQGECIYIPVPMQAMSKQMKAIAGIPRGEEDAPKKREPGGYL